MEGALLGLLLSLSLSFSRPLDLLTEGQGPADSYNFPSEESMLSSGKKIADECSIW